MEQENSNRKLFGFFIEIKDDFNISPEKAKILNQGVPMELVIMQMRAFLDKAEKDYFEEFNKSEDNN